MYVYIKTCIMIATVYLLCYVLYTHQGCSRSLWYANGTMDMSVAKVMNKLYACDVMNIIKLCV